MLQATKLVWNAFNPCRARMRSALFALAVAACGGSTAPATGTEHDAGRPPTASAQDAGVNDAGGGESYRGDASTHDPADMMMSSEPAPPTPAAPTCSGAQCPGACDTTHADCDGNMQNGCERLVDSIFSCGACDVACAPAPHASARCQQGRCGLACDPGYGDCDGDARNGCEQDLRSADHCGACGTRCSSAEHATGLCSEGACGRLCEEGYGDCDGNHDNGCEVVTISSDQHCGGCGQVCSARTGAEGHCEESSCHYKCSTRHFDCDQDLANGCECEGRRIFVTSQAYTANLGGLAGADAICAESAMKAGLPGVYKAWLSDGNTTAAQRLEHSNAPYYRLDGSNRLIIGNDWADLTDEVSVAVAVDEYGQVQGYKSVWTGTRGDGDALGDPCQNWTNASGTAMNVTVGNSSAGAAAWTFQQWGTCSQMAHLYCVEQ